MQREFYVVNVFTWKLNRTCNCLFSEVFDNTDNQQQDTAADDVSTNSEEVATPTSTTAGASNAEKIKTLLSCSAEEMKPKAIYHGMQKLYRDENKI